MARSQVDLEVLTHLGAAVAELGRMQQALAGVGGETERSGSKLDKFEQGLNSLGPAATRAFAGATAAVTGVTMAFGSYETELKNVQNISGATDAAMAQMTSRFLALPPTLGEADDLMRALYQTMSSGVTDADEAFGVVVNSAKAAKGNLADMTTTVDGLTSIMNAFSIGAEDSMAVLDTMTKTVDLGKLTFEELASNIGKSASIAAAAGVDYDELLGVLAALTLNGLSVEEAMTSIRAVLTNSIGPANEVTEAMGLLGVDMSVATIESEGLAGMMAQVATATKNDAELMSQLFPNVRAVGGAMALASEEGGKVLAETLDALADSAGKVESNYANMSDSTNATFAALTVEVKKVGIVFGELTSEAIIPLVQSLTGLLTSLKELDDPAKQSIVQMTGLTLALSGAVIVLPKLIAGYKAVGGALVALRGFAGAASMSVGAFAAAMGVAVAAGLALQYGINKLAEHLDKTSTAMNEASIAATNQAKAFQDAMTENGAKLGEYARQLGVTATEEEGLGNAIRKRLLELRGQGKLTKEQERVLQSYVRNLKGVEEATDEVTEAEEEAKELAELKIETNKELATLSAELAEYQEEYAKAQAKTKESGDDAAAAQIAFAESLGQVSVLVNDPEPLEGEARRLALVGTEAHDAAEEIDFLSGEIQDLTDEFVDGITPPTEGWVSEFDSVASSFGDMLGKGFMGELSSFGELWEEIWGDLAKSMTGVLGSELENWINGVDAEGNASDAGLFTRLGEAISGDKLAAGLGGLGMMFGGMQQGGGAGILQAMMGGAMSGASLGALTATPFGMVAGAIGGAIVGGIMAYFGGSDSPESRGSIGVSSGGVTQTRGQNLGEGAWDLFTRERQEEYRAAINGMNDTLRIFGDADLFDLIGDPAMWEFGGRGGLDYYAQVFREDFLPDAIREMFRAAVDKGLGDLNVTDDTITRLWAELGQKTGDAMMDGLRTYISAVVGGTRLLDDMDWTSILDDVSQTPRDAFVEFMTGGLEGIDVGMMGWDEMSLIEQAGQALEIQDMISAAREQEIAYLRQIDQISKGIADSIGSQIEKLKLGGMTDFGKADYAAGELEDIFATLMAGGLSPDTVQALVGDAQGYIDLIAGVMGEEGLSGRMADIFVDFFGTSAFGNLEDIFPGGIPADMTGRDFLIALLEQLGTVSEDALEEARAEAADLNQQYVDRLTAINERLTGFEGGLEGLAGEDGAVGGATESMELLNQKSIELGDEFERVTSALSNWDPNVLEDALKNHTVIDIDANLAPLITLIETIVAGRLGAGAPGGPDGIF